MLKAKGTLDRGRHATVEQAGAARFRHSAFSIRHYDCAVTITYADFERVDIRIGRIVRVDPFPEARKPAYKLVIDFGGEIGMKKSSAQATNHYRPEALQGRLVLAVVNFPPKQIGPYMSEVLTLGVPGADGAVVLVGPDRDVPLGGRLF